MPYPEFPPVTPSPLDSDPEFKVASGQSANTTLVFFSGALIGALLVVVAGLVWANLQGWSLAKLSQQAAPVATIKDQTLTAAPVSAETSLVFKKNNELWHYQTDGSPKQLTQTDGGVGPYQQNPTSPVVAYIQGHQQRNNFNYVSFIPQSVSVLNTKTQETKSIFTLEPTAYASTGPLSEYENKIRDLHFSKDGQLLAITTSQGLYVYNVQSMELSEIFNYVPKSDRPVNGAYAYTKPLFSPDNSLISMVINGYEGSSSGVVNLKTKELTLLPFGVSYDGGQRLVAWVNNSAWLMTDNREVSTNLPKPSALSLVSYPTLVVTPLAAELPQVFDLTDTVLIDDQTMYVASRPRGKEFVIAKINPSTGALVLLATQPTASKEDSLVDAKIVSVGDSTLYFTVKTMDLGNQALESETLYSLDLKSGQVTVLAQ